MRIFTCSKCSKIHLEIGNTQIHFDTDAKLKVYLKYLDAVDVAYYATINRSKGLSKEIILPLDTCNSIHLMFTTQEFETLKTMIRNYLLDSQKPINLSAFQDINLN